MPAPTTRRLAAVLTAALVAMLLAVTAGTAGAATSAARVVDPAPLDLAHHAAHPRLADAPDQDDHAVDPVTAGPAADHRPLGAVPDDRATTADDAPAAVAVPSIPRGPPGR